MAMGLTQRVEISFALLSSLNIKFNYPALEVQGLIQGLKVPIQG